MSSTPMEEKKVKQRETHISVVLFNIRFLVRSKEQLLKAG